MTPQALKTQPHVLISGYYGFDNLGDELILQVLVSELKKRGAEITVLSNQPEKTARQYGVHAIHRMSLPDIIDHLTRCHLFISGGGGLFQDVTGPVSPIYYGGLIRLARYFEVPVAFFSQGVGPLNGAFSRFMTSLALKACKTITVRDFESAELVEDLTERQPEITTDPVWLLDLSETLRQALPAKERTTWNIGISLRPWPTLTEARLKAFARFLRSLVAGSHKPVRFVLLPFQQGQDRRILQQLADLLHDVPEGVCELVEESRVPLAIAECDVVFGMRFHSLILALLADIPVYGLSYDPKVRLLLDHLGLSGIDVSDLETLDPEAVRQYFNHYPLIDLHTLKRNAARNFEVLDTLLQHTPADALLSL